MRPVLDVNERTGSVQAVDDKLLQYLVVAESANISLHGYYPVNRFPDAELFKQRFEQVERSDYPGFIQSDIRPYELMIGKVVPNIVLGYVQITIALLVAFLLFDVPLRGSLLQLYLLTMFFITASLGLGIMISNIARNQLQAIQMSFLVMLPSIVLSGFISPRAAMPKIIYCISAVIPMTYYLQIMRGIMLKGIGFP